MSNRKEFLRRGTCSECNQRNTVVAFIGRAGVCSRCDESRFKRISEQQKDNWLRTGKVFAQNV